MINTIYENEKEIRKIMKWYKDDIPRVEFWANVDKLLTGVKVSQIDCREKVANNTNQNDGMKK